MDTSKNNLYPSNKFIGRCPGTSKNATLFFIHRYLRDGQMQSVLGTSATVGFQLDLGVKLGVFYYTLLHLTREKLMRNDTVTYLYASIIA